MFAQVTCPTCNEQFGVPEATMGKRIACRNCQSPFVAGKSVAISVGAQSPPAPESGFNKTMIGEEEAPPIRYKCPRCKTPLEAPAIEAKKKKPCPSCGQRHQVPAAPIPAPTPGGALDKTMLGSDESNGAGDPNLNKTMLSGEEEAESPIQYNCPRCKKALEAPVSEAGTKRPCPSCGQRHKVPAAPPAAAGINKTMLTGDAPQAPPIRYECPRCKKPLEAPAAEAETKKPCPSCGQRHRVPAAPSTAGINQTMLASDGASGQGQIQPASTMSHTAIPGQGVTGQSPPVGIWAQHFEGRPMRVVGLAVAAIFLFLVVLPSVIRGGRSVDTAALDKAKAELAALKTDIEQKQMLFLQKQKLEAQQKAAWDKMMAEFKRKEERLENQRRLDAQDFELQNNLKKKRDRERKREEDRAKLDREKAQLALKQQADQAKLKADLEALKTQLQTQKQQQQTIIQRPAPVYYYRPYDYRYYRWWYP